MAISLKKRRVVTALVESVRGTFQTPTAADAIPTIREGEFTIEPIQVERPTLRLSLTPFPNTYPGQAQCTFRFIAELGGLPANPKTDYDAPVHADLLRACGFEEMSSQSSGGTEKPRLLQNVTSLTGGTAGTPLRHGETVTGNGTTPAGTGTVIGDFFAEDDVLCVLETTAPGTNPSPFTWTGGTSSRVASGTRATQSVVAFRLVSDVNVSEAVSMEIYNDGKRLQMKGAMGNCNILLDHGDMIRGEFTMVGVVRTPIAGTGYKDEPIPTNANELHKIAPTFLGREVRFYEIGATPDGYGRDAGTFVNVPGTPTVLGSLNQIRVNTGNTVVLRQNSLDPSGVSFALITARQPTVASNPDEVFESEFSWISKFINGTPIRFKAMIGAAGTVTTQDGNTHDIICPGVVAQSMGDIDRDGIQAWDGQFRCSGGNYSTAAGVETPGNDNEFTLIYR